MRIMEVKVEERVLKRAGHRNVHKDGEIIVQRNG